MYTFLKQLSKRIPVYLTIFFLMKAWVGFLRNPVHVHVVKSNDTEVQKVLDSINELCHNCLYKKGIYYTTVDIVKDVGLHKKDTTTLGVAQILPWKCKIVMPTEFYQWDEYRKFRVVIHEIGHCMGFDHDTSLHSVMSAYYDYVMIDDVNYFLYLMQGKEND